MARRRISRRSSRGRKPRRAMPAKLRRLSGAAVTVVALLGIGIILGFALAVGMGHRAEQTWLASGIRHAASPTKVARTTPAPAATPAAKVAPPAFVAKPAPAPVVPAAPTPPYVS